MADQRLVVEVSGDVSQLNKALASGEASLKKFQKTTAQTGTTVTNLARIAQDAPFGFIAIQNNLDPLIQSFGQLKTQVGGTGPALKALFASLAGPAGLALGFSVVSSSVTTLIQKYGSLGNAFRELVGELSNAEKFQQGYNKAVTESIGNAGKERAEINALVAVAKDENIQRTGRQQAIDKLKQSYPGLLSDLSLESINSDKVAASIAKINQQLILKAKIQGAEKFIGEQEAKRFEALNKPLEENLTFLDQARGAFQLAFGNQAVGVLELNRKAQKRLAETISGISEQSSLAEKELEKLYKQLGLVEGITNKAPKIEKSVTQKIKSTVEVVPSPASVENFANTADRLINDQFARSVPVEVPVIPSIPENVINQFKEFGDLRKAIFDNEQLRKQAEEFKSILQTGLAVPLGDLFFNFLDSGKFAFKDFADAAIKAIKRIVAQLVATKIIQLLTNLAFPSGGASSGLFSGLAGIFGGGVAAPNFGGVSGGGLSGQVVFVQRGTDLVGVLQRTNNRVNRVG